MDTRRRFLSIGTLAALAATLPRSVHGSAIAGRFASLPAAFAELERSSGGRLGVGVYDTGSGERSGHRTGERFAMCSTFKTMLVAAVLERVDRGQDRLDRALAVPPKPLVGNSPLTVEHAGGEMTLSALGHAAITRSDNTAANLLLMVIGGPAGLTRFARSLGDTVTRLDRTETSLNEAAPGDPRDTTSPAAMATNLQHLLLGDVLSTSSREVLSAWMIENTYGQDRLRANLPPGWRAADKTGSNGETTSNDIAVYWPARHAPVIVSAYLTECPGPEGKRAKTLAEVGRLVLSCLRQA